MKQVMFFVIIGWLLTANLSYSAARLEIVTPAYAISSCENSPVAQNWIYERNIYASKIVREWMDGSSKEFIASLLGLLWSCEAKLAAECRKEPDFLKQNLILYGETSFPLTIDTAPPLILRWLLNDDEILSPEAGYKGGGVK